MSGPKHVHNQRSDCFRIHVNLARIQQTMPGPLLESRARNVVLNIVVDGDAFCLYQVKILPGILIIGVEDFKIHCFSFNFNALVYMY